MRCFIDGPVGYPFDFEYFLQVPFGPSALNYAKLNTA